MIARGSLRPKLLLALGSLLITLGLAEAAVRVLSSTDADGAVRFRGATLRPYRFPVHAVEAKVAEYQALTAPRAVYDPDLGWSYRPGFTSADGLYHYDALASRAKANVLDRSPLPRPGTRRIALFGDSFTHGDSVSFAVTWGALLERRLREHGRGAEVLNFGVGGYGMDQAFLRWKKVGPALGAEVVLFGFQPENLARNLNLIRPLYFQRTDLPFSKPRFVIEGDALRLIDVPTVPPQELGALVRNFEAWPLARFEGAYTREDYQEHPWQKSRLLAVALTTLSRRQAPTEEAQFDPGAEAGALCLRIVDAMAKDVAAQGARFGVVFLPRHEDLAALRDGKPLSYAPLLKVLKERYPVADPTEGLLREAKEGGFEAMFADPLGHYSAAGHRAVAAAAEGALPGEAKAPAAGPQ